MPKTYSPEQRKIIIPKVIEGLRNGTPLTVICNADGMPSDDAIRDWADDDPELGRAIARARATGFDVLAMEALRIANTPVIGKRTKNGKDGREIVEEDMLGHRRLQVDTILKLLAKWDPKRYGDMLKLGDPDGQKIVLDETARATRLAAIVAALQHSGTQDVGEDEPSDDAR